MMKDGFILYSSMYGAISYLDDETLGKIFRATFEYTINGTLPEDKIIYTAFMFIKNSIDTNTEKWEKIRQQKSEAGKKHKGNQYTNSNRTNGRNGTSVPKMEQMEEMEHNGTLSISNSISNSISISNNKKRNIKEKKIYGELENVKLTDDEFNKLKEKYPNNYLEKIDRLSLYIASKGDKYKSHYATILNWERKDVNISRPKTQSERNREFLDEMRRKLENGEEESN